MKIVVAPDSFKGSLSAKEVCLIIQEAFALEAPEAEVQLVPMADGGEGTLETLLFATGGKKVDVLATGPLGQQVSSSFGVLGDGKTAVIEMALVAGLPMVPEKDRNPLNTTTFGVGELVTAALAQGYRQFIVGLGGSATNDGGLGMLKALGASFKDQNGQQVAPTGGSLLQITSVDISNVDPRLQECQIRVASDVKNPLCGSNGASFVYGPQKGATPEQVILLDQGLQNFAQLIEANLQKELQQVPGAGAAGGLGFAFLVLGAEIEPGAQIMAQATQLEEHLTNTDWVITGEGRSDAQTLFGKLPLFVAQTAKRHQVGTILLSGGLGEGHEQLLEHFVSCHAITQGPASLAEAMENAKTNLLFCARNIARLLHHAPLRNNH